jgi:hypothetical protein
MRVLRDKIRAATSRSKTERSVAAVVAELNPVLRGWAAYFRNGNSGRKFNQVDGYVHERLAIFASRKHGLRGRNWTTRYTYRWISRLGVYRLTVNVHWRRRMPAGEHVFSVKFSVLKFECLLRLWRRLPTRWRHPPCRGLASRHWAP